ncbi:MAG: class I SAM-dependent methyltransferase [Thermodesulfobacteriota bacterium]
MAEPLHHPELVPPPDLAVCFGGGDFAALGREMVGLMRELGLHPASRVLDIGCGAGRIAHALLPVLVPAGTYEGFDLFPTGIKWCAERYHPRFPSFRFRHVPVYNRLYYPYGTVRADSFTFPYPDASFDLAVASSVFTHMFPADVEHYLDEVRRVLAPGGGLLATFFLLDQETREAMAAGRTNPAFPLRYGSFAIADPASPEDAVAYDAEFTAKLLAAKGAHILRTTRGTWRGSPGETYQDAVLAAFG